MGAASIGAAFGGVAGFTIGLVAFGLAKVVYDTAANTWIGRHVAVTRRARAIGALETSWAAAFLVGVPIAALLIEIGSWRLPFVVVGVACLAVALLVGRVVPENPPRAVSTHLPSRMTVTRAVAAFLVVVFLLNLSSQLLLASYGIWLDDRFGLSVAAIGVATMAIGAVELVASSGVAAIGDRVGKRRSVAIGLAILAPSLALAGAANRSVVAAIVVLALVFVSFEFSVVSALAVATELTPDARAAGIGTTFAFMTAGRAIGTATGVWLFTTHGVTATGAIAALLAAAAFITMVKGARL